MASIAPDIATLKRPCLLYRLHVLPTCTFDCSDEVVDSLALLPNSIERRLYHRGVDWSNRLGRETVLISWGVV